MTALETKEIRLLLPAYVAALSLAAVPVWLLPYHPSTPALVPFGFGLVLLGLSSFGREFWLKTFSLSLAQPLERQRIWWTKVALLAGALLSVFLVWGLSCAVCYDIREAGEAGYPAYQIVPDWNELISIGGMLTLLAFVGGLWTTLLLRQAAGAFWIAVLVPGCLGTLVALGDGSETILYWVWGLYAAAGFCLAWWLFFRAQEVGWSGGTVALPWKKSVDVSRPAIRSHRPLAALFWKELQFHQVTLAGMGGLFLLHLGDVALRKARHETMSHNTLAVLELFGWLWLAVPFLVGAASVAEERKLGTMESHLTLSISRRLQFAVKLLFVLVIGGFLSAVLFWTAEGIATAIRASSGDSEFIVPFSLLYGLAPLSLITGVIALIAFYASTLTRNILQALAAAVGVAVFLWFIFILAQNPRFVFGGALWQGYLIFYFLWPTLTVSVIWLAWHNFKSVSETWRLWRRNLVTLFGALAFITVSTTAIYNRAWEFIMPLESAHGPARLAEMQPSGFRTAYDRMLLNILLPDGRVWEDVAIPERGRLILSFGGDPGDRERTGFSIGGGWRSVGPRRFLPGSNWVDVVRTYPEAVGIHTDGSLWVSESPREPHWIPGPDGHVNLKWEMSELVRFGDATNWQGVFNLNNTVYDPWHCVLLLRNNGTLWFWGTNAWGTNIFNKKTPWPGLKAYQPRPLVDGSDWSKVLVLDALLYGIKTDGTAWALLGTNQASTPPARPYQYPREWRLEPGLRAVRAPEFDHIKSFTMFQNFDVGLRENGTLWARETSRFTSTTRFTAGPMFQIGTDSDWTAIVVSSDSIIAGLKADGSLWMWRHEYDWQNPRNAFDAPPVRLGTHNDWRALAASAFGGTLTLAADGSIWEWNAPAIFGWEQPMLVSSRRPVKIENIFDH